MIQWGEEIVKKNIKKIKLYKNLTLKKRLLKKFKHKKQ